MRTAAGCGVVLVISAALVLPFTVRSQTRDAARAPASAAGTGRLSGHVVTMDEMSQPVRNAIVTIAAAGMPRGRSVVTDDDGRFAFAGLAAARYTITASKASYVTTAYGATRPGRPGTPVPVSEGQSIADLTVRIARGAVITGRVIDRAGQPVSFTAVVAIPAGQADGQPGLAAADQETFETDDRGVYRIFGLSPAAYLVAAIPGSAGSAEMLSASEVDATLARLREQRTASTRMPVTPQPTLSPPPAVHASPERPLALNVPIFFPGTASAADAHPVSLAIGEERRGIDIVLDLVPAHTIDGIIVGAEGLPPESIGLAILTGGPPMPNGIGPRPTLSVRPGADGRFRVNGVPPGRHTLIAWTNTTSAPRPSGRGRPPAPQLVASLHASVDLSVSNDIAGVALALQPVAHFKGRVVFEGSSAPPPDLTGLRLTLTPSAMSSERPWPLNGVSPAALIRPATTLLAADGSFEITNVMPNTFSVSLPIPGSAPGSGWWLRSAIANGVDLLDTSFDARAGVTEVVVTFSDRHTELSGTLQTAAGQPASDCFIVAFTTDRSQWSPRARRLQSVRPGTDGAFSFKDLPPGEYFLAALTDLDPDDWQDPALLSEIAAAGAIKISLGEGQRKVQDLRIVGIAPAPY